MISVCILTKNSEQTITRCVEAVKKSIHNARLSSNIHWIIVDDGSKDNTLTILKKTLDNVTFLHHHGKGYAYARKLGISAASLESEYFSFIDSDILVSTDFIGHCIEHLKVCDDLAGVSVIYEEQGSSLISRAYRSRTTLRKRGHEYRPYLGTGSVVYKTKALKSIVDKIDTRLSMGDEDTDIGMLLIEGNYRLLLDNNLEWSKHIRNPTVKEEFKRMWRFGVGRALVIQLHPEIIKKMKSQMNLIIHKTKYFPVLLLLSLTYFSGLSYGWLKWRLSEEYLLLSKRR